MELKHELQIVLNVVQKARLCCHMVWHQLVRNIITKADSLEEVNWRRIKQWLWILYSTSFFSLSAHVQINRLVSPWFDRSLPALLVSICCFSRLRCCCCCCCCCYLSQPKDDTTVESLNHNKTKQIEHEQTNHSRTKQNAFGLECALNTASGFRDGH